MIGNVIIPIFPNSNLFSGGLKLPTTNQSSIPAIFVGSEAFLLPAVFGYKASANVSTGPRQGPPTWIGNS